MQNYHEEIIVVVSAIAKTTNALEKLASSFFHKKNDCIDRYQQIKGFHINILAELFTEQEQEVYEKIDALFVELKHYLERTPSLNYDFEYDQIVPYGEILSTTILSSYLDKCDYPNKWVDIRSCLKTDDNYREASVDWNLSQKLTPQVFNFENTFVYITQGFIGSTNTNITTTLGREGSDYTAAILACIFDADHVIIWKDVPGIMTADPKWMPDSKKINRISYHEAIELAFYGAKIIHPKTIQPLKNKQIPLHVKFFSDTTEPGTIISSTDNKNEKQEPVFIQKKNQVLISILPNDFSFIMEKNLSHIFTLFAKYHTKVNLSQNSAISFSVCVDYSENKLKELIKELREIFTVKYNENLELVTIRHYNNEAVEKITQKRKIFVEQRSRDTAQFVLNEWQ